MYQTRIDTRHLPPELQELVDTIISGVVALASRANSNSDSNSLGGIRIYPLEGELAKGKTTQTDGVFNRGSNPHFITGLAKPASGSTVRCYGCHRPTALQCLLP